MSTYRRSQSTPLLAAILLAALAAGPARAVMPPRAGPLPLAVSEGFRNGLFRVAERSPRLGTAAQQGTWVVPVIVVAYADQPLIYSQPDGWNTALFDTTAGTPTGSVYDYYRWVSGGRLRVVGKVVAVVTLPNTRDYYAGNNWGLSLNSTPRNDCGLVRDALEACDAAVDWTPFDVDGEGTVDALWVVHAGLAGEATGVRDDLWSITSQLTDWGGGTVFETNDLVRGSSTLKILINRFSIMPELSVFRPGERSEIGVFCHEFGHTLGLPDLYDTAPRGGSLNVGPGIWCLMSTGVYGTDGHSPEYPSHLGAWPTLHFGWTQAVRPTEDGSMVLPPIESGGPILDFWFQGETSSEHYLVEYRRRLGFDRNIPAEGLIAYRVDEDGFRARTPSNLVNSGPVPAYTIVEADGGNDLTAGRSRGDARDPFPGSLNVTEWTEDGQPNTRSRSGATTNLALRRIEPTPEGMRFFAQVRARGWLVPTSVAGQTPAPGSGPVGRAALLDDGTAVEVNSEMVGGRAQVVMRTLSGHVWGTPVPVTSSSGEATEAVVAGLPGGDLAVVWCDTRFGSAQLYYRSRIRGVWTAEQRLTTLAGSASRPSISADQRGGIHLAWLQTASGAPRLMFMYFSYYSPFADPFPLTGASELPDAPAVAAARDGISYVLWPERRLAPLGLWIVQFRPRSGFLPRQLIAPAVDVTLSGVHAVVDSSGTLHVVWQVSGAGVNDIHYQQRPGWISYSPDTVVESRGQSVKNPVLAVDRGGGLQLVMEALSSSVAQVRCKEWEPGHGWQVGSTEVTRVQDGSCSRPFIVPTGNGAVSVLYLGYPGGAGTLVARDRDLSAGPVTQVPASPEARPVALSLFPNPLRPGATLQVSSAAWTSESVPRADVFDVAGRRVASVPLDKHFGTWAGALSSSQTRSLASGIYFVRLRATSALTRLVVLR